MVKKKEEKEVAVRDDSNLPVAQWSSTKWEQIKKMFIPKGVSNDDAILFIELAKAYDLSPFKRELWIVPYGSKAQVFCGRDGFLSIAHKSGMFNGIQTDFGYSKDGKLLSAETTVWNKSCEHPTKCKVFLKEYTTGRNLWASKPHVMLMKVAESSALRRAFNISGLYSPEEISHNETAKDQLPEPAPEESINKAAKILDAEVINDNAELPRGNFDAALKAIGGCWDIAKLERFRKSLNKRQWTPEESKFLLDASNRQQDSIVAKEKEDN